MMETVEKEEVLVKIPMRYKDYLNWNPDNGFLYEFNDGFAEPKNPMKQEETYIFTNITDKFLQTIASQQSGRLLAETNCWTSETQVRIPDISFYTQAQIKNMARKIKMLPAFVVEIISENDEAYQIEKKLREYFSAGVQTVWHIFPSFRTVHVFTSIKQHGTFTDNEDIFDASPAIPDLQMTVNELFNI